MSTIVTTVLLAGIGCVYVIGIIHQNRPVAQEEERRRIFQERQEIMNKFMESHKKRKFIIKFIDEIPELSYYEAAQLKNKLGDIYLEWNDE
jgi:hypothetical protein